MTNYEVISVLIVLIGAIGWVIKMSINIQKFKTTTEIELQKMQIQIAELKCDMANQKVSVDNAVEVMRKENREEHQQLFSRVNEIHLLLIKK